MSETALEQAEYVTEEDVDRSHCGGCRYLLLDGANGDAYCRYAEEAGPLRPLRIDVFEACQPIRTKLCLQEGSWGKRTDG